jgi:DnaJ family protein B protein 4
VLKGKVTRSIVLLFTAAPDNRFCLVGARGGYSYQGNAQEIFENFFGTTNPFATFGFGDNMPFASKLNKPGPKKLDPVTHQLPCTLTELYNGCIKKFNVTRKRFNNNRELMDETKLLTITIRPGWKKGTKITFPGEGDEGTGTLPPDVVFVVDEVIEPGSCFTREGNNLIYTYKLSLSDALTDCSLQIPTLDMRMLSIACPEVVSPYYEKLIPGSLVTDISLLFTVFISDY